MWRKGSACSSLPGSRSPQAGTRDQREAAAPGEDAEAVARRDTSHQATKAAGWNASSALCVKRLTCEALTLGLILFPGSLLSLSAFRSCSYLTRSWITEFF